MQVRDECQVPKVGRGSDSFMVRMPDGMRDLIKEFAAKNRRSMNAELLCVLEKGMETTYGLRQTEQ